jgi:hypothetical protein
MFHSRRLFLLLPIAILCASSVAEEPKAPAKAEKAPAKTSPLAEEGPKPVPVPTPTAAEIDGSIKRGIEFLLTHQNKSGSWGSPVTLREGGEIYAPAPGSHHAFRAAVTAMAIMALIETDKEDPRVAKALDQGETWLLENLPHVRRATPDCFYNVWAHAYSLQALAKMLGRKTDDAERAKKIHEEIKQQLDMLERYEVVDGGWAYYDLDYVFKKPAGSSIPFVTAAVLIGMKEVKDVGEEPSQKLIERGKASILRMRLPDFAYCYGEYLKYHPTLGVNRPAGSLGRTQACNYAMRIWGDTDVTDAIVKNWLDRLFARNGWLDIGRKRPIPHESWFQVAGYFFYFGHYYAARCIELLPENERGPYQDQMAHVMLALQEKDGSWWDYPMYSYHQAYGTAYALMCLQRCKRAEKPAESPKS